MAESLANARQWAAVLLCFNYFSCFSCQFCWRCLPLLIAAGHNCFHEVIYRLRKPAGQTGPKSTLRSRNSACWCPWVIIIIIIIIIIVSVRCTLVCHSPSLMWVFWDVFYGLCPPTSFRPPCTQPKKNALCHLVTRNWGCFNFTSTFDKGDKGSFKRFNRSTGLSPLSCATEVEPPKQSCGFESSSADVRMVRLIPPSDLTELISLLALTKCKRGNYGDTRWDINFEQICFWKRKQGKAFACS